MNYPIYFGLCFFVLFFTNLMRFLELKENTSMYTLKQYLFNKSGILYSLVIIGLFMVAFALNLFENIITNHGK
jgi:hypothetical protein